MLIARGAPRNMEVAVGYGSSSVRPPDAPMMLVIGSSEDEADSRWVMIPAPSAE